MSQPNTAAIVVGAIFGGIALLFVAYKAYCKLWNCMHRSEQLPPISQPPTAYHGGVVMANAPDLPTFASLRASHGSTDHLAASSASFSTSQPPQDGFISTSTSEMPSPSIRALDSVVLSTPTEGFEPHFRGGSTISSSSSTMTLKRSYLKSPSAASQLSYMSSPGRRESYLPHSPLNRDSIQIVPPQPLGFGGSLATATDQRTLAFRRESSIGTGEDFIGGFVWTDSSDNGSRSRNSHRNTRAHQERQRYLIEGPVSTRSSEVPGLQPSPQSSSIGSSSSLESQSNGDARLPPAAATESSSPPHVVRLGPKASIIDPQLLSAKDSPLQRLQSDAGQPRPPAHTRSSSHSKSNRSDSNASPILSPFVQDASPLGSQDRVVPQQSPDTPAVDARRAVE